VRAFLIAALLISAGSVASASPLKEAQKYEAQLVSNDAKLRMRENLERLIGMYGRAKKDDRRAALEGEARAWKLLAHWSGRADDRAKANEAERALSAPVAKKEIVKEASAPKAMLAKVSLEGSALELDVSGTFKSRRDVIPAKGSKGPRVFFDLSPMIASNEALRGAQIEHHGIERVRVGQFDDDTVRVVVELAASSELEEEIVIDGAKIALGVAVVEEATLAAVEEEAPVDLTAKELRAIVDEVKQALPSPEEVAIEETPSIEEKIEPRVEEEKLAEKKLEAPLDEATMKALKRSTREAVRPREESVLSIRRVVIDAGHGGKDQGAKGVGGVLEKDVNLAIAMKLGAELKRRLGVKVIYTRTTDVFLSLQRRSQLANNADADLFISVHSNAARKKSIHGIETYYLNTTSDRYSARLARRENTEGGEEELGEELDPTVGSDNEHDEAASLPPGALGRDLKLLLADLAMRSASAESKRLAGYVQSSLVGTLRRKHDQVTDLGVKHALFYVLLGARMPSILVETGFVTHATEGKRLGDPEYQSQVASSIAQGVARYVNERDAVVKRGETRDQTLASSR
jgi:N-acetylmuramoyl-L-alanine amidase